MTGRGACFEHLRITPWLASGISPTPLQPRFDAPVLRDTLSRTMYSTQHKPPRAFAKSATNTTNGLQYTPSNGHILSDLIGATSPRYFLRIFVMGRTRRRTIPVRITKICELVSLSANGDFSSLASAARAAGQHRILLPEFRANSSLEGIQPMEADMAPGERTGSNCSPPGLNLALLLPASCK